MAGDDMKWDGQDLEAIFAECFEASYRTILVGGGEEPLYLPSADPERSPHRVVYREDYFASALHEVAHWCMAGAARRLQEDYGYWYAPDGRSASEQAEFERVEARPQALESIFSEACGFDFQLSVDNLDGGFAPSETFVAAVDRERARLVDEGLSPRAAGFQKALGEHWGRGSSATGSPVRLRRSIPRRGPRPRSLPRSPA